MSKQYKVKPFPYAFCEGCFLNGCYPWSTNPMLRCDYFGGLHPRILVTEDNEIRECAGYRPVTEKNWKIYLVDCKQTSANNERTRKKAMDGGVVSNTQLPGDEEIEKPL